MRASCLGRGGSRLPPRLRDALGRRSRRVNCQRTNGRIYPLFAIDRGKYSRRTVLPENKSPCGRLPAENGPRATGPLSSQQALHPQAKRVPIVSGISIIVYNYRYIKRLRREEEFSAAAGTDSLSRQGPPNGQAASEDRGPACQNGSLLPASQPPRLEAGPPLRSTFTMHTICEGCYITRLFHE